MKGSARVAQQLPAEDRQLFTVSLAAAPSIGLSPRWVQYSGISAVACKVAEALADLAMVNTRGDQRPTLDRELVAYAAGLSRADKLAPYLRELQDVGFLTVFDGGVDPVTGKRQQRRGQNGRPLPDHFEINLEPPAGYVGPRNLTELQAQFIVDRDAVYRTVEQAGKTPRAGRHAIPRTEIGRLEFPQVTPVPGIRGQGAGAVPGIRGQAEFPQVTPVPGIRGPLQIDRSSISEREIEGSIEPVPGGAAGPPATGMDEGRVGAVRELVRRLPWVEWAELRNPEFQLTPVDADLVQAAICAAMASAGITLDQAAAIGQAALGDATKTARPVSYVVDAFRRHLPRRLRALGVEPLSDNPLPLLGKPKRQVGPPSATTHEGEGAATADTDAGESAKPVPACETCGAREGEGPSYRRVTGEDGREHPCPDCLPATA